MPKDISAYLEHVSTPPLNSNSAREKVQKYECIYTFEKRSANVCFCFGSIIRTFEQRLPLRGSIGLTFKTWVYVLC